MCPVLSWNMRLASFLLRFSLLISFMNLLDGEEKPIDLYFVAHMEASHSCCQRFFRFSFLFCLSADLLFFSAFLSNRGSAFLSDVSPSVAFFASPSTSSFPFMPTCPAVHLKVSEYLVELHCFLMHAAVSNITFAKAEDTRNQEP